VSSSLARTITTEGNTVGQENDGDQYRQPSRWRHSIHSEFPDPILRSAPDEAANNHVIRQISPSICLGLIPASKLSANPSSFDWGTLATEKEAVQRFADFAAGRQANRMMWGLRWRCPKNGVCPNRRAVAQKVSQAGVIARNNQVILSWPSATLSHFTWCFQILHKPAFPR